MQTIRFHKTIFCLPEVCSFNKPKNSTTFRRSQNEKTLVTSNGTLRVLCFLWSYCVTSHMLSRFLPLFLSSLTYIADRNWVTYTSTANWDEWHHLLFGDYFCISWWVTSSLLNNLKTWKWVSLSIWLLCVFSVSYKIKVFLFTHQPCGSEPTRNFLYFSSNCFISVVI